MEFMDKMRMRIIVYDCTTVLGEQIFHKEVGWRLGGPRIGYSVHVVS